jgi:hypothetical protein
VVADQEKVQLPQPAVLVAVERGCIGGRLDARLSDLAPRVLHECAGFAAQSVILSPLRVNPSMASDDQHTGEALANMISKATKAHSCLHALKHVDSAA